MNRKTNKRRIGASASEIVVGPQSAYTTATDYESRVTDGHSRVDDGRDERYHDNADSSSNERSDKRKRRRFILRTILAGAGALLAHKCRVNYIRKISYDKGYKEGYRKGAEDSLSSIGIRGASYQNDNDHNMDTSDQLIGTMNSIVDAYSTKPELILKIIGATNHFFFQSHTIGTLTALLDLRRSHLGIIYDDVVCLANELYTGSFSESSIIGKALQARDLPLSYDTSYGSEKVEGRGYLPAYSAILKASCLAISYSIGNKRLLNKTNSYSVAKLTQADLLERILGNVDINQIEGIWQWNLADNSICRSNIIYEALPFLSFDGEKPKPLFSGFTYYGNCIIPMLKTSPSTMECDEFYLNACIEMKKRISPVLEKYSFYQPDNALNKLYSYNTTLNESSFLGASTLSLDRLQSDDENGDNHSDNSESGSAEIEFNKYFWDKVSFYQLVRSYTITVSVEETKDDKIIHIVCLPNTRAAGNHTGIATFQESLFSGMSSIFQTAKDTDTGRNYIMGPMRTYCTSEYVKSRDGKIVDVADKRDSAAKQSYPALFLSMAGQTAKGTGFFVNKHSDTIDVDGKKGMTNNLALELGQDPEFYEKWGLSYAHIHYSEDGYEDSWYQPLATDSTSTLIKSHASPFIS